MTDYLEATSVEQFGDANARIDWRVEYRQLRPGRFRARLWETCSRERVI